ncbi:TFIIH subunit Tfb4/p34 [Scheffersomyces amazonensis]|uniref:TFIIH subunit Tfb4/p34 n=1 Tax=Scheffersomyces amazonensis TaxID=1078765 RepID=UPI00315DBED2
MDAISDSAFREEIYQEGSNDDPSLLTVILDLSPSGWYNIRDRITINELVKAVLVFLNAHLSLNNSNQVAFIASSLNGSKFLYPNPERDYDKTQISSNVEDVDSNTDSEPSFVNKGMYRQFRLVDEAVAEELNKYIHDISSNIDLKKQNATLSGALSMALCYTNRMLTLDQSITTTTASAINSTTNATMADSNNSSTTTTSTSITSMKSRILIISASDEDDVKYIPIMNSIFAAQKMKLSIDIVKLGHQDSSYLQQASDATNGIYLHIIDPRGIIQFLTTAFFIEPSIRQYIILPTNSNVNYRASCFITGKSVDLGYVCSVCLCIMSIIPETKMCPACRSEFDPRILAQLTQTPEVISKKKRKLDAKGIENGNGNGTGNTNGNGNFVTDRSVST